MDVIKEVRDNWQKVSPDNMDDHYDESKQPNITHHGFIPTGVELVDQMYAALKPVVKYPAGQGSPVFAALEDEIWLLHPRCFPTPAHYAATCAHELTHWSGHASRLDRATVKLVDWHAPEECVAELTAALVMDHVGQLTPDLLEYTELYVAGWLRHGLTRDYSNDPMMFFFGDLRPDPPSQEDAFEMAVRGAEQAFNYLLTAVNAGETK